MKSFFICLIALMTFSCSIDNEENINSYIEVLPIVSVSMPEYFEHGETYQIDITYLAPTNCHYFNDIYYDLEGNTSHVAILNTVVDNGNCETTNLEDQTSFNFEANTTGLHIFKFWQGEDENGQDMYLLMEVTVE